MTSMTSSIKFNSIPMFSLFFIIKQVKNTKNGAKSVQDCAKKAQISIIGEFPIMRVIVCSKKMAAPTKIENILISTITSMKINV